MSKCGVILFIKLSFLLGACSSPKFQRAIDQSEIEGAIENNKLAKEENVVDISFSKDIQRPNIGPEIEKSEFGPQPLLKTQHKNEEGSEKLPVIGLFFGPGLNRVLAHLSPLKAFSDKKIHPNIISGNGLGAIVGAMYAHKIPPDEIEWRFFKFFRKVLDQKPFSRKWLKVVDDVFLEDFKHLDIQDLKLTFLIPLYNRDTEKIEFLSKGNLRAAILRSLMLFSDINQEKYLSSLKWNHLVRPSEVFSKYGADFFIYLNVLGNEVQIQEENRSLINYFAKRKIKEKSILKEFSFRPELNPQPIDDHKIIPNLILETKESSQMFSKKIDSYIEEWKKSKAKGL